jgi:hypothetical protein
MALPKRVSSLDELDEIEPDAKIFYTSQSDGSFLLSDPSSLLRARDAERDKAKQRGQKIKELEASQSGLEDQISSLRTSLKDLEDKAVGGDSKKIEELVTQRVTEISKDHKVTEASLKKKLGDLQTQLTNVTLERDKEDIRGRLIGAINDLPQQVKSNNALGVLVNNGLGSFRKNEEGVIEGRDSKGVLIRSKNNPENPLSIEEWAKDSMSEFDFCFTQKRGTGEDGLPSRLELGDRKTITNEELGKASESEFGKLIKKIEAGELELAED